MFKLSNRTLFSVFTQNSVFTLSFLFLATQEAMKIVEVFRVSPYFGSENQPSPTTSLPLTFFDVFWLRLPPVQRIFFYEFPHKTELFLHSVLSKLKESLALALGYYFPLAGNLFWPHDSNIPIIRYDIGDTLSLTLAQSDADFNHLSGFDLCEASESHHLLPQLTICHEQSSVLALQVTLFPNSGFSIGITSHHAVLDGKTSTSFMKSWAYLCKNLGGGGPCSLPPELIPFFDREVVKDPNELNAKYVSDWLKQGGPNNRSLMVWDLKVPEDATRGIFHLSRSNIEKLKQFVVSNKQRENPNLHLSTLVLSLSYALVCRVKSDEEMKSTTRVGLALNVDCRARLDPPIPPTYFGNCVGGKFAFVETRKLLEENGLIVTVEAISAALETLKDGVLKGAENWSSMLHDGLNTDEKLIGAAGAPRFEVYSCDFGWERPKKVEMASIDRTCAFCLSDRRDGDGIEIGFVSKKAAMEAFASMFVKWPSY